MSYRALLRFPLSGIFRSTTRSISTRSSPPPMASHHADVSKAKHEYLVVVPDHPNTQEERAQARAAHIRDANPLIESGKISYFGVTIAKHAGSLESDTATINGSVIVFRAESEADIREALRQDAYTQSGVWNVDEAQIWPFKSG